MPDPVIIPIEDSILNTIKKMLGLESDYDAFDTEITVHINSVLMTLTQLGVGPVDGYIITDATSLWTDFLTDISKLAAVKTYMYLKVKLVFDPPTSSFVQDALTRQATEWEWRLATKVDPPLVVSPVEETCDGCY